MEVSTSDLKRPSSVVRLFVSSSDLRSRPSGPAREIRAYLEGKMRRILASRWQGYCPTVLLEICNDFLNVRGLLGPEKQARDQSPAAKRVGSALELSTSGKCVHSGTLA